MLSAGSIAADDPETLLVVHNRFAEMLVDVQGVAPLVPADAHDLLKTKLPDALYAPFELTATRIDDLKTRNPDAMFDAEGRILVSISLAAQPELVKRDLESLGIAISTATVGGRFHSVLGWLPLETITRVASMPDVRSIEIPEKPTTRTGTVNSAGDGILRSDTARSQFATQGINGSGIRVGVISDGVTNR